MQFHFSLYNTMSHLIAPSIKIKSLKGLIDSNWSTQTGFGQKLSYWVDLFYMNIVAAFMFWEISIQSKPRKFAARDLEAILAALDGKEKFNPWTDASHIKGGDEKVLVSDSEFSILKNSN